MPRRGAVLAIAALIGSSRALAQTPEEPAWSYTASGYAYAVPGNDDYFQPTFTVDHRWLHLEARHNYEGFETSSVWAGYNFSVGEKVTFEGTAMAGAAFGSTSGFAPGYKATLSWTKLTAYSEGEYFFDTGSSSDSFFYSWSELSWSLNDWCRVGLVGQHTRVYQTDRDIQRGVLIGFGSDRVAFTGYFFNLDDRSPTSVVSLTVSF